MAICPVSSQINRASFSIWTKDAIKKISIKKVTEPKSFEKAGAMHPDGLYSPAFGSIKRFESCYTCGLNFVECPGHYGHIELSVPVFHPMLVQTMYQILSKCCLECFHFRLSQSLLKLFLAQMEALNCGFDHLIDELDEIAADMCRDQKGDADPSLHVALGRRLMNRIKEEKAKTIDFDCQKRPQQRSIVERLSKLFRNFINGKLIKPAKICPNCSSKKIPISLHQQSVLVVGSYSSRPIDNDLAKTPKGKLAKKPKTTKRIKPDSKLHYLASDEKKFLTPIGVRYYFRQLWKNEKATLQRIFHFLNLENFASDLTETEEKETETDPKKLLKLEEQFQPVDLFFIDTILVPPTKFRPPMSQRGYHFEGPRTAALSNVMKQSLVVQDYLERMVSESDEVEAEKLQIKTQVAWKDLQKAVNSLYDSEMDKYNKNKYPGLKQLIDKKEGLFRKNMMGKRVNFAARSVISPDPNISVDQIGVPLVFAKKLSYPEPVTPWNIQRLREAVLNGPYNYPGAISIVFDDGTTISLAKETTRQIIASRLSYNPRPHRNKQDTPLATIVNRHLVTGDMLLFNRQPTLHKPSIMAFRARVLPNEKGFRLHYANCKSFNADFDGDEMNAHLPQSELARSEAYNIASVNHQYLVPKDGSPLGGLIQDHVVAVTILTRRDQFFGKDRYHQLVYCALSFLDKPLKLESPAIIKPGQLWTGKQVITTVIKNCIPEGRMPPTLDIKSKIGPKILRIKPEFEKLSDCHVIIRNGELVVGFMDKSNVGATQYGLIHICYELYGGETSSNLMSAFARLSTWYLQLYEGFTLGIKDILIESDADHDRQQYIIESLALGSESAKEALGLAEETSEEELIQRMREAHCDRDPLQMKKLDAAMKTRTDKIASNISGRCLPEGLISKFPDNNLQMMIQSGAKGGTVNALQISCLLGQIELEGRRVPLSVSGRSLPSFKPYDTSPKAGGFVTGRFLTGIQPQEFFFHCMAGREGLIDTAVKTSRSGYLQRCLIKHLEGITVHYDQTVRDSCGSVIQFLYGEDGLDIVKSQMLKDKAFPALVENYKIIGPSEDELERLNKHKSDYEEEVITRTNDIQQWLERNGDNRTLKVRGSGFLDFFISKLSEVKSEPMEEELDVGEETKEELSVEREELEVLEEEEGEIEAEGGDIENSEDQDKAEEVPINKEAQDSQVEQTPDNFLARKHSEIFQAWYALSFKEKRKWNKFKELCPDPLTAVMNPASHFGVVPERLDKMIEEFVKANARLIVDSASLLGGETDSPAHLACDENAELSKSLLKHWNRSISHKNKPKLTKHEFYNLCYNLYMKMLAQPGEAVGLLAAQSIGEPSTQMTLNTFHFAGRGEMNVTLGIPRLREILMTASAKIGTPSMDLPLLKLMRDEDGNELDEAAVEEQAKLVKLALNAVRLSDVLEYVDVSERTVTAKKWADQLSISGRSGGKRKKGAKSAGKSAAGWSTSKQGSKQNVQYQFHFVLLPSKYYKHEFKCNSRRVLKFIEEVFVGQLTESMVKRQKRLLRADEMFDLSTKKVLLEKRKQAAEEAEGDSDQEEHELEDYNAKVKAKDKAKEDESSSDEEEEEGDGDNTAQKLKSRRNQDLDYEEPEEDDLEVGDVEAKAAEEEEEEEECEILIDEADADANAETGEAGEGQVERRVRELERRRAKAAAARLSSRAGGLDAAEREAFEEEEEEDESAIKVKEEIVQDQLLDERPVGQSYELAGFDDSANNTRTGFVTPPNEAACREEEEVALTSGKEPARKRTKLELAADREPDGASSGKRKSESRIDEQTVLNRINQVLGVAHVVDYKFDTKRERWCKVTVEVPLTTTRLDMRTLIETEAKRTFVYRVGNIQRALIVKDVGARARGAKCDKMIKTEGVSLLSLVRYNHILDLNAIYSNDIHAVANTYGIEAASQAIRREMANVFAVYGIEVDGRHLSLIADYMTYNGSIRGMNRLSMEASASPFQQMSYESTLRYLKWAAVLGLYDDIKSPSAALVFGRPTRGGTGQFSLLADPSIKPARRQWSDRRQQQQRDQRERRQPQSWGAGVVSWSGPWGSASQQGESGGWQTTADNQAATAADQSDSWGANANSAEWDAWNGGGQEVAAPEGRQGGESSSGLQEQRTDLEAAQSGDAEQW